MNVRAEDGGLTLEEITSPGSPLRRYYEELAFNLMEIASGGVVVVTGAEVGVGTTSTCLGLGAALAGMERRVMVVDCDVRSPGLHRALGEPNFVGLTSGLIGERPLEEYAHEIAPGLEVLPAGPTSPSSHTVAGTRRFVEAVRSLAVGRDLVLLDAPTAGEVVESSGLARGFSGVLLVIHASRTPKQNAREATDDLLDAGVELLGVVLNGCP